LTAREFDANKAHTTIGATILEQAAEMGHGGFISMAAEVARYHHERWDGAGYPLRLVER
jgi:putative two-component system response regulator